MSCEITVTSTFDQQNLICLPVIPSSLKGLVRYCIQKNEMNRQTDNLKNNLCVLACVCSVQFGLDLYVCVERYIRCVWRCALTHFSKTSP